MVSTVRSVGIVPSTMTATGVDAGRPPSTSAVAIAGALSTAISRTTVPRIRATRVPRDQRVGVAGREVAGDHGELVRDAAVGHRDPEAGRDGDGGGEAGHDGDRHVGGGAGEHLLEAAAEDEVVAALEADDALAGAGAVDDHLVDGVLRRRAAAGQLGDVDQLDVGAELVEQLARREPVGDDDVGRGERVAGGDGDEVGLARAAADEHDAGRAVVGVGAR